MGYGAMHGIPMVATSPVRHESPVGMNPVEIQSYEPPWKQLTDFALHTDLDRLHPNTSPHFQHLVNQVKTSKIKTQPFSGFTLDVSTFCFPFFFQMHGYPDMPPSGPPPPPGMEHMGGPGGPPDGSCIPPHGGPPPVGFHPPPPGEMVSPSDTYNPPDTLAYLDSQAADREDHMTPPGLMTSTVQPTEAAV